MLEHVCSPAERFILPQQPPPVCACAETLASKSAPFLWARGVLMLRECARLTKTPLILGLFGIALIWNSAERFQYKASAADGLHFCPILVLFKAFNKVSTYTVHIYTSTKINCTDFIFQYFLLCELLCSKCEFYHIFLFTWYYIYPLWWLNARWLV